MIYLYSYIGAFLFFVIGYMLGMHQERKYGAAASQKIMDQEIAEYDTEQKTWDAVKDAVLKMDQEPASKRIKQYGHLRLIK
jgi:hypothetical protein